MFFIMCSTFDQQRQNLGLGLTIIRSVLERIQGFQDDLLYRHYSGSGHHGLEDVSMCHSKIKFISSSRRVMFFLLYTKKDIDNIIEGNYRNYVIDKLTCEITVPIAGRDV